MHWNRTFAEHGERERELWASSALKQLCIPPSIEPGETRAGNASSGLATAGDHRWPDLGRRILVGAAGMKAQRAISVHAAKVAIV
jgi:hypothetical protein